jgi:hypothetical protein
MYFRLRPGSPSRKHTHTDSKNRKHVLWEGLKTLHNKIRFYLQKLEERTPSAADNIRKTVKKRNSLVRV